MLYLNYNGVNAHTRTHGHTQKGRPFPSWWGL